MFYDYGLNPYFDGYGYPGYGFGGYGYPGYGYPGFGYGYGGCFGCGLLPWLFLFPFFFI